ncbi:WbqC family protein [Temperatibacter marinus]|uniref:WbqC family protein n=1 Tax=Temperatibacter marinus TaxID=1456591 RepID=A0AA52HA39_9PROT|nr:WbqC family protein [Temperatibacter marinus]WND03217.1 WbqC family protein [Temperatibacter marinus]
MSTIAIMQPYLFPYIGYYHLLAAAETFVFYDDVNFMKGSYINRNQILTKNGPLRFTLSLDGAGSNKLINEISLSNRKDKCLTQIENSYRRAPYFEEAFALVQRCYNSEKRQLSDFLFTSIKTLSDALGLETKILRSTELEYNRDLKGQDKVIELCKMLAAETYVNAIGGKDLYDHESFNKKGLQLNFINPVQEAYTQYLSSEDFVPYMSIIDTLMFCGIEKTASMIKKNYTLEA